MPDRMGAEESLTDDAELEDLDEQPGFGLRELDSSLLSNPVLVRAVGEIAVASLVLFWPDRTDRILAILIGVAVLIVSSTALWGLIRQRSRRLAEILPALAGLVAAVWLLVSPNQSEVVLARYVGAAVLLVAARDLMLLWRGGHRDSRGWVLSRSVALVGMGTLLIAFPAEVFVAVTVITALTWIAFSLVVVVVCLDERTTGVAEHSDSLRLAASCRRTS